MTYDELKNGLKSLFSTLGAKTSDSNYGVALLDKTSGEPKGLMGMSALASVLGASVTGKNIDYGPFSGYNKTSVLLNHNTGSRVELLISENSGSNYGFAIRSTNTNSSNPIENQTFQKVYHEGMLNDSDAMGKLASALGVAVENSSNIGNLDTEIQNSRSITAKNATGVPVPNAFGYLVAMRFGGYGVQLWTNFDMTALYIRGTNVSTVGSYSGVTWRKADFTAV